MGILSKFEKNIERAVNGVFSKAFHTELEPVDLASALRNEMDTKTTNISKNSTLSPNYFAIKLHSEDYEKAKNWGTPFVQELCEILIQHAKKQNYILRGPVKITFSIEDSIHTGKFEITAKVTEYSKTSASMYSKPDINQQKIQKPDSSMENMQIFLNIDGNKYPLKQTALVIGRSSQSDIIINDTGISRKHLEIRINNNQVVATDLGSTNGSFVNGKKIISPTIIDLQTKIVVGKTNIIIESEYT